MPIIHNSRAGVALVVGVGDYLRADRVNPLRYARSDAEALARALADPHLCAFPPDQVLLLTNADARRDELVGRLSRWLPERARGSDLVVVYFAGHGTAQTVGPSEEGFLLPYDADPDDLVTRGIAMSDLARWIDGLETHAVVVCLDCCHAGKLLGERAVGATGRNLELTPLALQGLTGRGRYLIASCDQGQKSFECAERRHGLFTYHLLQGIGGAADADGDGRVGLAELFNYVSTAVCREALQRFGASQKPWTSATWAEETYISFPGTNRPTFVGDRIEAPAPIAAIFRNLSHEAATIRAEARAALHSLGWDNVVRAVEALARQEDSAAIAGVLEGLNAFEAHPQVVGLLDRLVVLLRGEPRNRAILLLERKRLGVGLEKVAAVFRDIQSPYQPHKALGQGLCTDSYLARADGTELDVVVRVLRPEFAQQPHLRAAFLDLSRRSLLHVHENLVLTREVRAFPERDVYYCVRDYIHGVTLQTILDSGKRFEPTQAARILLQTAAALTPLHRRGLFHGGIKPSNIFLCPDDLVVLGDPCLQAPDVGVTRARLSYDYRYAAPEVFGGKEAPGPAADWYALGCVAFELLCGNPPFVSDNWHELAHQHAHEPVRFPESAPATGVRLVAEYLLPLLAKSAADRPRQSDVIGALNDTGTSLLPRRLEGSKRSQPLLHADSLAGYQADQSVMAFEDSLQYTLGPNVTQGGAQQVRELPGYEILEVVGRGGMGVVYKARQLSLNRVVAIKVLPATDPRMLEHFGREAQVVARLQHPNIVQVYDFGQHHGVPFFSMEFIAGGSLAARSNRVLPPREAAALVRTVALAVHHAHERGIIHRDLKPANILLDEHGEPHLTDFGLAAANRQTHDACTIEPGAILGTPVYMAPEQAQGAWIGPATDVWSLGVILFELLTGARPFQGDSVHEVLRRVASDAPPRPRTLKPDLPHDLEAICLKALEKDPARRYASTREMADALESWLTRDRSSIRP